MSMQLNTMYLINWFGNFLKLNERKRVFNVNLIGRKQNRSHKS